MSYPAKFTASDGVTELTGDLEFTAPPDEPGGIGQPGTTILRGPFPFDHTQSVALAAGVELFTPKVGDIILDAWVEIDTAFDGTTPKADIGTFNGGDAGLFAFAGGTVIDLKQDWGAVTDNAGLLAASAAGSSLSGDYISVGAVGTAAVESWQIAVTAANPLLLVASQSGAKAGTAIDSTVGAGKVFVLMATPLGS